MKDFIKLTLAGGSVINSLWERCDTVLVRSSCVVAMYPCVRGVGEFDKQLVTTIALTSERFVDVDETIDKIFELMASE